MKSTISTIQSDAHLESWGKIFLKKRSSNISNHYLKALKGEVERSKDRILAMLDANIESCEVQWSKTSMCMWVEHYVKENK